VEKTLTRVDDRSIRVDERREILGPCVPRATKVNLQVAQIINRKWKKDNIDYSQTTSNSFNYWESMADICSLLVSKRQL